MLTVGLATDETCVLGTLATNGQPTCTKMRYETSKLYRQLDKQAAHVAACPSLALAGNSNAKTGVFAASALDDSVNFKACGLREQCMLHDAPCAHCAVMASSLHLLPVPHIQQFPKLRLDWPYVAVG